MAVVHTSDLKVMERDPMDVNREELHRLAVAITVEQNRRTREFIAAENRRGEEA